MDRIPRALVAGLIAGSLLLALPRLPSAVVPSLAAPARADEFSAFDSWLGSYLRADSAERSRLSESGRRLVAARQRLMFDLIRTNPELALQRAVSLGDYARLPDEIRRHLEKPFSIRADLEVVCTCFRDQNDDDHVPVRKQFFITTGVQRWTAFVHGRRLEMPSKRRVPLQGIVLDQAAAVRESPVAVLAPGDATAARTVLVISSEQTRCPVTGEKGALPALAGGELLWFAGRDALETVEQLMIEAETLPGPETALAIWKSTAAAAGTAFDGDRTLAAVHRAASSWTATPKRVLCLRLDFSDAPGEPISKPDFEGRFDRVSEWFREMSYGKSAIDATVPAEVYRLPHPQSHYRNEEGTENYSDLRKDALDLAAAAGYRIEEYDIDLYAFRSTFSGWSGRGTLGGSDLWLNGVFSESLIAHELGHNFGLDHASSWNANDGSVLPLEGEPGLDAPAHDEYGDIYDRMGSGSLPQGHFHPHAKHRLNWITGDQVLNVTTAGTYRLHRFDHAEASPNETLALKVQKGRSRIFWVTYRRNFSDNAWLSSGATVLWQFSSSRCRLLDMTPDSSSTDPEDKQDAALPVGRTFTDPTGLVHITPVGQGGETPHEYLEVKVELGFPGNREPTVVIEDPGPLPAGRQTRLLATASDPDGDDLEYTWSFGDGTAASGPSVIKTFPVGGTYQVRVQVTDRKGGNAEAALMIEDPLYFWGRLEMPNLGPLRDMIGAGFQLVAAGQTEILVSWTGGSTWARHKLPWNIDGLNALAAGSGRIVAVGRGFSPSSGKSSALAYMTDDALSWSACLMDGSPTLNDVAFGDGAFIAVGDAGAVYRSETGADWRPVASGIAGDLKAVAFGDGAFLAVGDASLVLRSIDGGRTWRGSSSGLPEGDSYHVVVQGGEKFVVGGPNGVFFSPDGGQTWSETSGATTGEIESMAYGDGVFFALARRIEPRSETGTTVGRASTDGTHWIEFPLPSEPPPSRAVFCLGEFYLLGSVARQRGIFPPTIAVSREALGLAAVPGGRLADEAFLISNGGAGEFEFTIMADQPWIQVSPASGRIRRNSEQITLTFALEGLPFGTYLAAVHIRAPGLASVKIPASLILFGNDPGLSRAFQIRQAVQLGRYLVLAFEAGPGKAYAIEASADLGSGRWRPLAGPEIIRADRVAAATFELDPQERNQFFRVVEFQ